jgi:hypothetical protein
MQCKEDVKGLGTNERRRFNTSGFQMTGVSTEKAPSSRLDQVQQASKIT